jgi:F0F1-type ATP synthase delta subunit
MSSLHIDEFKELLETVIDTGDINKLQEIIKSYKNIIDNKYISLAEEILDDLLDEKLQENFI